MIVVRQPFWTNGKPLSCLAVASARSSGIVVMATGLENFAEFNSEPYMHTVIPNLVNLGLLTSRTAEHWKRLGMMSGKRADGQIPLVS